MNISILLTTYNRVDDCKICLARLLEQDFSNLQIEILLLDDWHIENKDLKEFCSTNNIKYIHTGRTKKGKVLWRVPGYAYNIGAKLAKGKYYIIGGAEMYHINMDCIQQLYNTGGACSPIVYDQIKPHNPLENFRTFPRLNNKFPFCYGVPAEVYHHIGGYDEDFIGYCFDDDDFTNRVQKMVPFKTINAAIVHLWQVRGVDNRGPNINQESWYYNQRLCKQRKNILIRNTDKEWGKF